MSSSGVMTAGLASTGRRQRLERVLASTGAGVVNTVGGILRRSGLPLADLDAQGLIGTADASVRLSDYGDYSPHQPLEVLVRALESEASLNMLGRLTASREILRLLRNRLFLQRDRLIHPEIARERVERPLFILGLPRSGTTLLHALLAQDPGLRYPAHWELMYPSPPPESLRATRDPRIDRAGRELRWFYRLAPQFRAIHMVGANDPQECVGITDHTFLSLGFDTVYNVPSYRDWVDRTGLQPAYAFHRQMLQHLQWRCPPRQWVLKAPDHVFAMDDLLTTYPDARIVMTHRDPLQVVPSVASLTVTLQSVFSDAVDAREVARTVARRWADGARLMLERRSADKTPGRYLDVHYLDLLRHPMHVVRDLYAHLGMSLPPETTRRMERFLGRNPQGRNGRHHYSLEQFGLDAAEQREKYRDYVDFFGVAADATTG